MDSIITLIRTKLFLIFIFHYSIIKINQINYNHLILFIILINIIVSKLLNLIIKLLCHIMNLYHVLIINKLNQLYHHINN